MNYNIYKNTEVELMTQKYYRYNFAIEKLPLTKTDYETIDYVALTIKSISLSFDTSKIGEFQETSFSSQWIKIKRLMWIM